MHLTLIVMSHLSPFGLLPPQPLPTPSHPRFPPSCPPPQAITFRVSASCWTPIQFFLRAHPKPLLPPIIPGSHPPVLPTSSKLFMSVHCTGLPSVFLRLHAKPLLHPIIPGFHPPVLPTSNKHFMSVHCSHFITFHSLLYASLPPNIKPTYPYFFKQYDDFEMQISNGKGVNMASITTNLMVIVVVKNYFGL